VTAPLTPGLGSEPDPDQLALLTVDSATLRP